MKRKNQVVLYVLAMLIFGCSQNLNSFAPSANPKNEIGAYLKELHRNGKLNGNVLVVKDDQTLYEKSFGYADGSKSILLNKNFRFNIGSVYKEFPAVAIMQLSEKNLLKTDDKIQKYLPDLPNWAKKISIKHLLQYSSGLPNINANEYVSKNLTLTDELILGDLQKIKKLEFEPGTDYLYTNYSPILLMKIVEKITKKNFKDYARENIFEPFGLKGTVIKDQYPYKNKDLMAIPFDKEFKEDKFKTTISGVLFTSTINDMYLWFKQLDSFKIISKDSVKFLSETVKNGDNIQSPLGAGIWKDGKIIEHTHHGSMINYECVVRRFKQDDLTIVILTNQNQRNVYDISNKIREIISKN